MAILGAKIEGVDIPQNVLEFICYNIKNNIRELEGVMVSLLAQSASSVAMWTLTWPVK